MSNYGYRSAKICSSNKIVKDSYYVDILNFFNSICKIRGLITLNDNDPRGIKTLEIQVIGSDKLIVIAKNINDSQLWVKPAFDPTKEHTSEYFKPLVHSVY